MYKQILETYGEQKQKDRMIEECAELICAILNERADRPSNMAEEIADVHIVLEQMKLLHPDWGDWKHKKLRRTATKITVMKGS